MSKSSLWHICMHLSGQPNEGSHSEECMADEVEPIMAWWCFYTSAIFQAVHMRPCKMDYTHHTKATAGFSREVDKQLIMHKMHLHEAVTYDKHRGKCQVSVKH